MTRLPSIGAPTAASNESARGPNDLRDLDMSHFLDLMITELQNQDPLNPVDNSELLQQLSQIREISATNKLTDTLESVLNGQQLATASTLIGQNVNALTDDNSNVSGIVDRVSVEQDDEENSILRVHIGNKSIQLKNIREILK